MKNHAKDPAKHPVFRGVAPHIAMPETDEEREATAQLFEKPVDQTTGFHDWATQRDADDDAECDAEPDE